MKLRETYKNADIRVKAGIWFAICNILQKGISIITVPIFTRILTTEQYGTYSVYLSWMNILSIFTTMNLYYGVYNKALVKYDNDRDRYESSMQGLTITLSFAYFVLYLVFHKIINGFFELSTFMMIMMFIEMMMTSPLQFWMGRKRFDYDYVPIVKISILKSILNPFLGVIGVFITSYKTEARIVAAVIVEVAIAVPILVSVFAKGRCFFKKKYWKYAFLFNLPLIPHYLSGTILNQGDRIVIQKMRGATEVAKYSIAYNVGMLTQLLTNAISQSVTPWLYECLKKKEYGEINKRLRKLVFLVLIFCIVLMLMAPEVVWLFASSEYSDAVYVIPPIAASVFYIYIYNIYSNFEFYYEKRAFISVASLIAAVLNVILNIIFVPIYGYVAAGYTTLACYMIYAFAHFSYSALISRRLLKEKNVFDISDIIVSSIILCFSTFLISLLYANTFLRYCVIAIIVFLLILFRKKIYQLLQMLRNK